MVIRNPFATETQTTLRTETMLARCACFFGVKKSTYIAAVLNYTLGRAPPRHKRLLLVSLNFPDAVVNEAHEMNLSAIQSDPDPTARVENTHRSILNIQNFNCIYVWSETFSL